MVDIRIDPDQLIQMLGAFLLGSDAEDIGKFDRIHHWQVGAALMALPSILDGDASVITG